MLSEGCIPDLTDREATNHQRSLSLLVGQEHMDLYVVLVYFISDKARYTDGSIVNK